MSQPATKSLPINFIRVDGDTQSRAEISWETVAEYAEAWLSDAQFPPLDVFLDDTGAYFLADGFHRYLAAKRVHRNRVSCRVYCGSSRDAFLFACTANQTHGLRRTNADKRHMVGRFLSDQEWIQRTDSWIAEQCGVSHTFVASMRREHEGVKDSAAAKFRRQPRRGADGKQYPPDRKPRSRIGSASTVRREERGSALRLHGQRKALHVLKEISVILQHLGIYDKHELALSAIARDIAML